MRETKFIGEAEIPGLMFHLGGFPAINLSEQFSRIKGEVYELSWDQLLNVDVLEGVGRDFYDRVEARVEPHGIVWTYIFPRPRASRCDRLIPTGVWQGPETPSLKWAGFGRGVNIGKAVAEKEDILVGDGTGDFCLVHSSLDQTYKMVHKKTGEIVGSYKNLRNLATEPERKILTLPDKKTSMQEKVAAAVQQAVKEELHQDAPSDKPVVLWTPQGTKNDSADTKEEENIPQAARLLGLKYGAA